MEKPTREYLQALVVDAAQHGDKRHASTRDAIARAEVARRILKLESDSESSVPNRPLDVDGYIFQAENGELINVLISADDEVLIDEERTGLYLHDTELIRRVGDLLLRLADA